MVSKCFKNASGLEMLTKCYRNVLNCRCAVRSQLNDSLHLDVIRVYVRIYLLSSVKKGYHDTHPTYPQVLSTYNTTHNLR